MKSRRILSLLVLVAFVFETGCSMMPLKTRTTREEPSPAEEPASTPSQRNAPTRNDLPANTFIYPASLDVTPYSHLEADTLRKLLWLRDQQIEMFSRCVDSLFFQVDSLNSDLEEAYSRIEINPDFVIPDTVRLAGHLFDLRNERYREKFSQTLKTELRLANVWIPRSGKYFALFDSIFAQTRVPKDVKYLAVAESSLNSMATSWAGAAGIWQFMASTGKTYKLVINDYIDERRNAIKSAFAAARYLEDAYDLLASKGAPDWLLAFCAYNAGAGRITQVINEQGGKDFFNLIQKVDETNQYVWRALAIKVIFQYEEQILGRKLEREPPMLKAGRLVNLTLRSSQDINEWAKARGTTISKVWELNPWIKMHKTSRGRKLTPLNSIILGPGEYQILIPRESVADTERLARIEREFLEHRSNVRSSGSSGSGGGFEYYTVRKGDNLGKIASRYGLTVQALKSLNGMKNNKISVGQRLRVRVIPGEPDDEMTETPSSPKPDSLKQAKPDSLKKAKPDSVKTVAKPDSLPKTKVKDTPTQTKPGDEKKSGVYVVKKGDTLLSISKKLNVTVDHLVELNKIRNKSAIQVGQKLKY